MKRIKALITVALALTLLLSLSAVPTFAAGNLVTCTGSEPAQADMVITADRIDRNAFANDDTIVNLTIKPAPNQSVVEIGSGCFNGMSKLETVTFEGKMSFGACFWNCPNLTKATFLGPDKNQHLGSFTRNPFGRGYDTKVTIYGPGGGELDNDAWNHGQKFISTNGESLRGTVGTNPDGSWTVVPDVTGCSGWAKDIITSAIQKNIVPSDLQSKYTNNITRQEMCHLVMQLLRQTDVTIPSGSNPFTDVNDADVTAAAALGIVNGVSPTAFNPSGSITREQAATMLTRFAKLAGLSSTGKTNFVDAPTFSSWAADGIAFVSGLVDSTTGSAVMGGVSASVFSPKGTFTREQVITTTLRLANILEIQ